MRCTRGSWINTESAEDLDALLEEACAEEEEEGEEDNLT